MSLLDAQPEPVLARPVEAIAGDVDRVLAGRRHGQTEWAMAFETFVRRLLSHIGQPTMPSDRAAGRPRWLVERPPRV